MTIAPKPGTSLQLVFFALLVLLGWKMHGDYGISFDDVRQRFLGLIATRYVVETVAPSHLPDKLKDLPDLATFEDRDYGVAVELPLVVVEWLSRVGDKKDVFLLRHLLTCLLGIAGVFAVSRLATRRYGDWRIGLLAALLVVTSPRLVADSFYNTKDGAFMAVFAIAMATLVPFVLRPGLLTGALAALASALAIDVRIVAVMLPLAAVAILVVRLLKREVPVGWTLAGLFVYASVGAAGVVAMWPWLWADPLGHFAEAFRNMSRFRWDHNVLYFGQWIRSNALPWHYVPVWIALTTPMLPLGLFLLGGARTGWQIASSRFALWRDEGELQDLIFLGLCLSPVAAAALTHAVLYDAWRQMHFVYPAFVLVAVRGWMAVWQLEMPAAFHRPLLVAGTIVALAITTAWMVRVHPFQNVYFNELAGKNLRSRFELDYWGLANRQALEHILAVDKSPTIYIRTDAITMPYHAFNMIDPADRGRLQASTGGKMPEYLITNWRYGEVGANTDQSDGRYGADYELFYRIEVDGESILTVFRHR